MPTVFDSAEADMASALATAFGEVALHTPRTSSGYTSRATDPDRLGGTIRGVFSAGEALERLKGETQGGEFSGLTRSSSLSSQFWMSAAARADAPSALKVGDAIAFTERPGSPVYAITRIEESDRGDANLILAIED